MKTILITLFTISTLWACSDASNPPIDPDDINKEDAKIALSFVQDNFADTRAFSDNVATPAELKVNSVKLFIFQSDYKLYEYNFTASDLTANSATVSVHGMAVNIPYAYYVIINHGDLQASSLTSLKGITESDIASYNGIWSTVADNSSASNRTGGFVMTGTVTRTPTDLSQTQTIPLTMTRIVAKVDINTTINATKFGSGKVYPGTMTIDSAKITQSQASMPLILGTPSTSTGTKTLGIQIPNAAAVNSIYQNRFYVFENGALATGSRMLLSLYATYTNGLSITPIIYTAELSGNSGSIVRNGSYAVNVSVNGLTSTSITVQITLGNWETIVTQPINVGS